jgi:hypothetical protein
MLPLLTAGELASFGRAAKATASSSVAAAAA